MTRQTPTECDSPCVRVFNPSEPNRCMCLQLSGDFSVLAKLPHSLSSICHPVRAGLRQLVKNMLVRTQHQLVCRVGASEAQAQSFLSKLCAHCSSPPHHPRTLCSPTLIAAHRFHTTQANWHDQLLCLSPFSIQTLFFFFPSHFVWAFLLLRFNDAVSWVFREQKPFTLN